MDPLALAQVLVLVPVLKEEPELALEEELLGLCPYSLVPWSLFQSSRV